MVTDRNSFVNPHCTYVVASTATAVVVCMCIFCLYSFYFYRELSQQLIHNWFLNISEYEVIRKYCFCRVQNRYIVT